MQLPSITTYWQQLSAVHDRARHAHRTYLAARDALFSSADQARDERSAQLWLEYCKSVGSLQSILTESRQAVDTQRVSA